MLDFEIGITDYKRHKRNCINIINNYCTIISVII
nr:MAG TPA: hypothetical protein [Bacteriophage sp.]